MVVSWRDTPVTNCVFHGRMSVELICACRSESCEFIKVVLASNRNCAEAAVWPADSTESGAK